MILALKGEIIGLKAYGSENHIGRIDIVTSKINNGKIYLDNNDIQGEELFNLIRLVMSLKYFLMDDTFENNLTFNNKKK